MSAYPTRALWTLTSFLVLTGCAVGPDYVAPSIDADVEMIGVVDPDDTATTALGTDSPDGNASQGEPGAGGSATSHWWTALGDPLLTDLLERGLSSNLDIRAALIRIEAANAGARRTGVAFDGSVSAQIERQGGDGIETGTSRSATLGASWVQDLFGGLRREREAAMAEMQATSFDAGTTRLAFLSDIVGRYLEARYYQSAIAIAEETRDTRQQTLAIVNRQRRIGTATDLDVANARVLLEEAKASLPGQRANYAVAVHAMAALLDASPGELFDAMADRSSLPGVPAVRGGVTPAALLANRPDVLSAERALAAATASVGVAEAARYPSVQLDASRTLGDSASWRFGPSLLLPLLQQGALVAARDEAVAEAQQAELEWRASVLSALQDARDAWTTLQYAGETLEATRAAANASDTVRRLSTANWQAGNTTLLDTLDAERAWASARLSVVSAQHSHLSAWVAWQVTSGLGWR